MANQTITEIKRGETGTGLLIENDAGFISSNLGNNRKVCESRNSNMERGEIYCPFPFVVDAVLQRYGAENANGRIYPEDILKREVDNYQTKINERRALAELNHPSESTIDLERVAINVIETNWVGNTLVGKIEIITSPGFRKYGIITCLGDQTANLLLSGYKIGLSSRGLGTVENKMGSLYVASDYELICFDVVSDPSTKNAWIMGPGEKIKNEYINDTETQTVRPNKNDALAQKLASFDDWLNR